MKKQLGISCLAVIAMLCLGILNTGCSKVEAGHVGVKVYLLGGKKGVDNEILGVGRYWIGWNEELYLFPTFQQTIVWTKGSTEGSTGDDSFTFQTREGLSVNADVGLSYTINPDKVATLFQRYRKGVDEITRVYLRSVIRDALVQAASTCGVESIYGDGKSELIAAVKKSVSEKMEPVGIIIDYISFVGDLRLPQNVIQSINAKIEATQRAQQRENELREAEAQAKKNVAEARGKADALAAQADGEARAKILQAEGEAKAVSIMADAQARANKLLASSITPELVQYNTVTQWDGKLPQVSGGATPFVTIPSK